MNSTKSILVVLILGAFTSLTACVSSGNQESTGQYVDSSVITTRVKAAILNEPSLKSLEISVETFKGEVQLSGFVSSIDQANKAVEITQKIPGVTSVKNDMRVKGSSNPFYK